MNSNAKIPSMRTIHQAYKTIRLDDQDSALTETALRRLVNSGELPTVKVGNKRLVNMDILREYLAGESFEHSSDEPQAVCGIRRVAK